MDGSVDQNLMNEEAVCDVVIAQFIFGAQRCMKPAVTEVTCEEWPDCSKKHPVCEEHSHPKERNDSSD